MHARERLIDMDMKVDFSMKHLILAEQVFTCNLSTMLRGNLRVLPLSSSELRIKRISRMTKMNDSSESLSGKIMHVMLNSNLRSFSCKRDRSLDAQFIFKRVIYIYMQIKIFLCN